MIGLLDASRVAADDGLIRRSDSVMERGGRQDLKASGAEARPSMNEAGHERGRALAIFLRCHIAWGVFNVTVLVIVVPIPNTSPHPRHGSIR
jgi:hypothetical protein